MEIIAPSNNLLNSDDNYLDSFDNLLNPSDNSLDFLDHSNNLLNPTNNLLDSLGSDRSNNQNGTRLKIITPDNSINPFGDIITPSNSESNSDSPLGNIWGN